MENDLKDIVIDFIQEYEAQGKNMDLYSFYADFKRNIENKNKEKKLTPLFISAVTTEKINLILTMEENQSYVYEEIDYLSGEIVFQMIIKAKNCSTESCYFDIVQVLFGNKLEKYLPDDIYDTESTLFVYNNFCQYDNEVKLYKYHNNII